MVGKFLSPEFLLRAYCETEYVGQVISKCYKNFNLYDLCFRKKEPKWQYRRRYTSSTWWTAVRYQTKLEKICRSLENFSTRKNPIPQSLGTFTMRLPKAIVKNSHICPFLYSSARKSGKSTWRIFVKFLILNLLKCCRIKDLLDVTCYFISLLMCSTCFGH